jgi:hypothetical protein
VNRFNAGVIQGALLVINLNIYVVVSTCECAHTELIRAMRLKGLSNRKAFC